MVAPGWRIRPEKSILLIRPPDIRLQASKIQVIHMVAAIFWVLFEVIHLLVLAVIAAVVVNLLISFGIANPRNQIVAVIADFLTRITEPMFRPIRRVVPYFGTLDLSPLITILLLEALQMVLADIYGRLMVAGLAF